MMILLLLLLLLAVVQASGREFQSLRHASRAAPRSNKGTLPQVDLVFMSPSVQQLQINPAPAGTCQVTRCLKLLHDFLVLNAPADLLRVTRVMPSIRPDGLTFLQILTWPRAQVPSAKPFSLEPFLICQAHCAEIREILTSLFFLQQLALAHTILTRVS